MKKIGLIAAFLGLLAIVAFVVLQGPADQSDNGAPEETANQDVGSVPESEVLIEDIEVGEGPVAERGDTLTAHYTGTLEDGTKFDSSLDAGEPLVFQLGAGQLIQGWDLGVEGMRVGGTRRIVIPPELAYGEREIPGVIPANSTLIFDITLLGIEGKE